MFDSTETPDLSPGDLAGAILREPITVSPTTPVMAAIALMDGARARDGATSTAQSDRPLGELDARAGCVVVVASNKVVGLLTERDVVGCCAQGQDLHQVPVSEVMTTAVQPLHEATMTDLATVMQLLQPGPMRHWPVVNEQDDLVGLVTSETLQPLLSVALYKRTESLAARGQQLETETAELLNLGQRELEGHIAAHTQQLQTQLQREQVVAQLATQIRSALELQTILDNSVEQIRQILGCDRVFIYKFRPDFSGTVVAEALLGEMTSVLNVNVNDPCITPEWLEPYRQGAIRVVNDVYEASMAPCHQEMLMGIGIRAKLMVPIIVEQQLWGLMIASHQVTPRQWQPDEIKLVQQLSLQVSIAIQQALIYKRLQHELRARQQAKNRLQIKSDLLALVATQDSLTDTLTQICLTIEEVLPGALCSVLLVDRTNRLQEGAAPSLPAPYRRQIQGVSAEEGIGSCGTAAHRRAPVIVADIANDALWQNFKDLALAADLRACWSTPILTADGEVLGTFGIYYREVRSPQADDLALLENVTDVVALAILRHRNDLTLKQTNQRLQEAQHIAHLGNWELDLQHNTLYWSEEIFHIFEIDPQSSDASYAAFLKVVHPDDRPLVDATYRNHLCDLQPYSLVHRLQMPDGRIKYVRRQCETTFNTEGMPLVSRGTVQDITQQQLAEMRRERAETSLRQVIEGTAACTGEEFFPALVRHIAEALDVRCVAVSRATSEGLQALAFFKDGKLCPPPWLPYDAVPYCQQTIQTGSCCYPAGVQSCYPGNSLLADLEVESYLGVGLRSAIGDPTGTLSIFHDRPLTDPDWGRTLLTIFAARAGAELERLLTAQALETLNAQLEARVAQRTAALTEREARYRALLDGAADAILVADLQGNILEANQKAETLLGYSLAELTTLHFTQLHPPAALDRARATFSSMVQHQRSQILDIACQRADGTLVPVDITATVINLNGDLLVQGIFRDVSERKAAAQALQESRQFLQTVLDTVPLGVFWKDKTSRFLGGNRFFLRNAALGSMAELVGKTDFDMPWATTEAEAYRADDLAVMVSGEAKLGTIETLHRQDGTTIWVETNKLPLRNLAGEVIGLLGTYQDITDRRTAELAQERQLAAIEAAVDGIAILQDGRYLYLNSAHATMFGYASPQELVGQSWRVLYSPEELERFDQDILPVLHQHMSWQGEVLGQRKDGTTFPEQLSLTLSADNLLICVCQDISERARLDDERKQTALALQHSETRFRRVFASNVVGMMFTEFSGLITDANDRFLAIIGYSRADLEARRLNWTRITPPEYAEIDQQAIAHLQRYGEIRPFEKEYLRPDGSRVAVLIGVAMLSQETGLCVCVVVDISVRKAAEAELRHTNAALERATRLKDEFLANMSHELRTPLNAILGMTEGLQEEVFGPLTDRQRRSLNTIERSGTHLLSLINDILDLSKVEAGQLELEFTYLDVSLLCNSSLTFVKQQALKKNLQLEAQIPQNLPNLYGDELRLRQVLINLLTNAVKFTPSGGCITLSATYAPLPPEEVAPQQTWVHPQGTAADTVGLIALRVADTGIGISPTNAQKLFQPFVQIDSALNRQYTGTGLGLSLVKRITEMHGGQVDLVSEVGVGSCFTVQLPIMVPISGKCLLTAGAPATPTAPAEQTKTPLILLAEDNEANVQTTTAYLTAKGYRLVVAQNGHGAVNLAQTAHPDLILMDIQMPGISGLEAIRQIRQIPALANIPIIALTALAMPKDRERCLAAGANEYISKPIRFQQLFQSIQTLLSQG